MLAQDSRLEQLKMFFFFYVNNVGFLDAVSDRVQIYGLIFQRNTSSKEGGFYDSINFVHWCNQKDNRQWSTILCCCLNSSNYINFIAYVRKVFFFSSK